HLVVLAPYLRHLGQAEGGGDLKVRLSAQLAEEGARLGVVLRGALMVAGPEGDHGAAVEGYGEAVRVAQGTPEAHGLLSERERRTVVSEHTAVDVGRHRQGASPGHRARRG